MDRYLVYLSIMNYLDCDHHFSIVRSFPVALYSKSELERWLRNNCKIVFQLYICCRHFCHHFQLLLDISNILSCQHGNTYVIFRLWFKLGTLGYNKFDVSSTFSHTYSSSTLTWETMIGCNLGDIVHYFSPDQKVVLSNNLSILLGTQILYIH